MEKINQKQFLAAMQSPSKLPTSKEEDKSDYISPNSVAVAMEYEQNKAGQNETQGDRVFISDLFSRLNTICTAGFHNLKMLSASEAQDQIKLNMREWMNEFQLQGMNKPELVEYALGRIRASGSPFIPTVGEFLSLCDAGRLPKGTLSGKDSYEEWFKYDSLPLERREPSNLTQATYHTMSVIFGSGMKGHLTASKPADALKYWCTRYEATINKLKEGRALKVAPEPTHKLDHISQPASKGTAMSALAAMRKGL